MSTTTIEWARNADGTAGRTWNPVTGCTKVSPGCEHCYAENIARRFASGPGFPRGFEVTLHPARLGAPLRWRKPTTVFVNSMSDLFHAEVPDEYIAAVWCSMAWTSAWTSRWNRGDVGWRGRAAKPVHTFQVLTKRHARMRSWVSGWGDQDRRRSWVQAARGRGWCDEEDVREVALMPAVLDNVWLGVSVEDQRRAELRIPALLQTPAAVRFLSCEPLLGPVDLGPWTVPDGSGTAPCIPDLHWVIAGGESGPGARPMHPGWVRQLRDQCEAVDVPFLFKQWGAWGPAPWTVRVGDAAVGWTGTAAELAEAKKTAEARGATHCVMADGHVYEPDHKTWSMERVGEQDGAVRRWGKKAAGRLLDGALHDAMPERAR